ncbi:zinc metallochaperone AztD [Oryzicola mucosus]|uniref:Metallochaperone AztD n=1 Tax=Oryzicola mucosus TaxID=2767425 RepID=A0A8J6PP49_9HYPH|nr:zinc metallochaperone AztD [Oryzicola mucosus]MBD0415140.1 metallochaperone AztD [Oryzicola mucosus]
MRRLTLGASALAIAATLGGGVAFADEDDVTAWRLFVSDHAEPVVKVIDALDGDLLDTFKVEGPATLHRTSSGAAVFAVQGGAGEVNAIKSGIAFHDHGDHGDIDIDDAELLHVPIDGSKPAHFVEVQGNIAQWFDGEDEVRVFTEKAVLEDKLDVRTANVGAPHHGVAVPYQNHVVVSIPNPEDASKRPIGARVVDFEGNTVGEDVACPGLHGSAGSGSLYALACDTGLLLIKQEGGAPTIEHLPYASSLPEGSSSTLIGGKGLQYFIGNYGADRIVIVDPSEGENGFQLVQLPTRRVHFTVDPIRSRFAYVITEDGQLHKVDVLDGKIAQSLKVTDPYSMDGHWSDPRPRVAVAGENVIVTDPLNAKLHLVNAETFAEAGEIAVEGKPFNIVAVGGSGKVHDDDGEEAHAHSHEHAHSHGDDQIYKGYFEDSQIKDRALSDWEGDWQSVYPYLQDGTLDPVMAHKAESGEQTAEEYKAYYEVGYKTDVERITIDGDIVTFFKDGKPLKARYASDGHEILTYEKGNRGVRFIFKKVEGDADTPEYFQFSDHKIAPAKADHYHLYWGDDRAALLKEVTNWPTYYPSSLNAKEIVEEMMAH